MLRQGKGSGVTQSDVSASTGEPETAPTPTRSSRAERNAAAADLDRSRGSFAAATPVGAVQLAEIEEVDPATVFQRDGAGFPDWLAANLDRLAKELGLSGLREVGRDVGVGSFTVDLLGQSDRGRRVAIMSHLEPSDHLHLGQMITFAAGLDVAAVVWITTRIGEEHRAVLDWLNQHGDDDVRFFGIELRLLRIGGSPPAASFHVEARPNDWQKVIRQRQRVGSPLNSRMREF
jgi:hypothetical protein